MTDDALREWAMTEQLYLWDDFRLELHMAANGVWSIGAASVAMRIAKCGQIIGPAPWREVPWDLWAGDVHAALYELAGVTVPQPDPAIVAESRDVMVKHRAENEPSRCLARYAETIAAMRRDTDLRHELHTRQENP